VYTDLKSTALRVSAFGLVPVLLAPVGLALLFLPSISSSKPRAVIWLRQLFLRSSELLPLGQRLAGSPRDIAGFFVLVVAIVSFFFLPHGELTELFGRIQAPYFPTGNAASHGSFQVALPPTAQALKALQLFVSGATVLVAAVFLLRGL